MRNRRYQRGFTFLEMALSLFVTGALVATVPAVLRDGGAALRTVPLSSSLQAADAALQGFLYSEHRLPCPASSAEGGVEDCRLTEGFLPWSTLKLPAPVRNADRQPVAYAAYRGVVDLAVSSAALTPRYAFTPAANDNYQLAPPRQQSTQTNGLDVCAKLRRAALAPATSAHLATRALNHPTAVINMAYVLTDPGAGDRDRAGGVQPAFDARNQPQDGQLLYESDGRPPAEDYDDHVHSVGFTELFDRFDCPALLASVSAAAREVDFADDYWRTWRYLKDFRDLQLRMRAHELQLANTIRDLAIFEVAMTVALGVLDTGVALAGGSGAAAVAVNLINAVSSISLSAVALSMAIDGASDKASEKVEAEQRRDQAQAAVAAAAQFRAAARETLLELDRRGVFR